MKCLFLYNPNSGRGKIAKKLNLIRSRLGQCYECVDVVATASSEDLEERVRKGADEYDAIVFSGGDGTFNNVLQGLGDKRVRLGYLPAGTANDVAHSLGIPRSVKGALKVVTRGHSERLDCMLANKSRYVLYVAAAGSLTSVTYETEQRKKRRFGWLAYFFRGLKNNMRLTVLPFAGECGAQPFEMNGVLAFVLNGRSVAGFPVNRKGSMQDGLIELAVVRQAQKPNLLRKIGVFFSIATMMVFGIRVKKRDIEMIQGDHVRIRTAENVVWDFDGERGLQGDLDLEILRGHFELFVPSDHKR